MRTVVFNDEDKTLDLNFMWLPTWVGMNSRLRKELEDALAPVIVGSELTEKRLDEIDSMVIEFLCKKCPLVGLADYLDGLKFVRG